MSERDTGLSALPDGRRRISLEEIIQFIEGNEVPTLI